MAAVGEAVAAGGFISVAEPGPQAVNRDMSRSSAPLRPSVTASPFGCTVSPDHGQNSKEDCL